jgi:putative ABC transport system permease protein
VRLNGLPATIVGVVAPPFRGTLLGPAPDVWVPLVGYKRATGADASLLKRLDGPSVRVNGRLTPGTSLSQARAEMVGLWARLQGRHPELRRLKITVAPYSVTAGMGGQVDTQSDRFLVLFSIVTIMTLLIVCANVANLLLARAAVRQRETALRQALGASRPRVIRALLAEGLALSATAWVAACLFAWWSSRAVRGYLTATIPMAGTDAVIWPDLTPDWAVLGYALLLAALATVACTVAPAIKVWRQPLLPLLKSGEQAVIQGRSKLSSGLVVLQLALSVLLVTCAGLAYRSIVMFGSLDSGFDTHNLLLVTVDTAGSARNPAANAILIETFRDKLQGVPGVEHLSYSRSRGGTEVRTVGSQQRERVARRDVGPGYLQVLGLPLLEGRALSAEDRSRAIRSAVITTKLAEALWPGLSPLGRTLQIEDENAEVVGIIPDVDFGGLRRNPGGVVFLSAQQEPAPPGEMTLVIRYNGTLDTIGPAVRRGLQQADAGTSIVSMRTWDDERQNAIWPITALTTLLMFFAGGSLLIAAIGQYAVVSFNVQRRRREFGLRMALGASARQVLTSVVREGFRLTTVGLAVGFTLSLATGRVLGRVLYGVTPTDSLTYGAVFTVMSVVSLLACYLPALCAARIDPMSALRHE